MGVAGDARVRPVKLLNGDGDAELGPALFAGIVGIANGVGADVLRRCAIPGGASAALRTMTLGWEDR